MEGFNSFGFGKGKTPKLQFAEKKGEGGTALTLKLIAMVAGLVTVLGAVAIAAMMVFYAYESATEDPSVGALYGIAFAITLCAVSFTTKKGG